MKAAFNKFFDAAIGILFNIACKGIKITKR
jgi:hypothetical protein